VYWALTGCSNPPPAEAPPEEEATPAAADTAATSEADPAISDEAAALIAETEGTAPSASSPPAAPATEKGKGYDLVYRVKPDELRIEVLSAAFVPTVKAVRIRGGWGVEVKVEATATSPVSLAATKTGPMAFAATVHRPAEEKVGDTRSDGQDLTVGTDKPLSFTRTWPGPDEKPLQSGQELLLQVGLWGIGPSADQRKTAKKFFEVKLSVDKKGGTASVAPPK
jgi:hypothetical protein